MGKHADRKAGGCALSPLYVLGVSVNIALRPLVQALSNRRMTTTQSEAQTVLDQRLAFLEDRLRRMEQSVTPLLDDDLLRRG